MREHDSSREEENNGELRLLHRSGDCRCWVLLLLARYIEKSISLKDQMPILFQSGLIALTKLSSNPAARFT
jgi:hypothetical protein